MAGRASTTDLKKLSAFSLWAIGVGLVISGESFGWNLGWGITGPIAFFIPLFIAALLYFGLTQALIRLGIAFPDAEGPQTYITNVLGKGYGRFIGMAILAEFLFATPAVANAIGEYLGFLGGNNGADAMIASSFIMIFCFLNIFEIKINIWVTILLTFLAIAELIFFSGSIIGNFNPSNFAGTLHNSYDIAVLFKALPYAIWMFLAIEGLTLYTKYIRSSDFKKSIIRGYNFSFFTLLFLSVLILVLVIGGISWNEGNWSLISVDSHPMPVALSLILGKGSLIVKLFTFIGLFGLIASLQGVSFAATEQIRYFIRGWDVSEKAKRVTATLVVLVISLIAIWGSQVAFLIEFTVFGAVCLYIGISIAAVKLNNVTKADSLEKGIQTKTPISQHPVFPLISVIISVLSIIVFAVSQQTSFLICCAISLGYLVFLKIKRPRRVQA